MLSDAIERHAKRKDLNCAGSIVAAVIEEYKLPVDPSIIDATSTMGGGMNIEAFCGTITGCIMALGLMFNKDKSYDSGNMKRITQEFFEEYHKTHDTVICKDLKQLKPQEVSCMVTTVPRIGKVLETIIERELARKNA